MKYRVLTVALGFLSSIAPGSVFAALGGNAASVEADRVHLQANLRTTQGPGYTVHELRLPTGIMVREYVSPAGTVFGVAWQGPWPPDMRQLLGDYFEPYAQARQSQGAEGPGRRPLHVEIPGLVVHMEGHPRSYAGFAYVPEAMPQGMSAEEIR